MGKRLFRSSLLVIACLTLSLAASAQDFHKSYSISMDGKVRISSVSGDIIIKSYNGDSVQVTAIKTGRDRDMVEVEDLSSGNTVELKARYPEHCNCDASIRFEVMVPSEAKYDFERLSTASGDIEVTGARGTLTAKSASGDVNVTGFSGEVQVATASGDINISDVSGSVNARAASGDLNIQLARLEGSGPMEFSTASGDVIVSLPSDLDAEVSMSTVSGTLETDFPNIEVKDRKRGSGRQAFGRLGNGSRTVKISTASGDVRLKRL
jgi:lia operon protein LiaG